MKQIFVVLAILIIATSSQGDSFLDGKKRVTDNDLTERFDEHIADTNTHSINAITGLQNALDGKAGTGSVTQVSSDLSDHESATGTNVHGLSTMSTQSTSDYYTASATDYLLDGKTGTNTTAALDDRVSVVETGKVDYTDSTYTDTVAKAASALQSESYTGDFKADGSVPMSGPFDGGGQVATNLGSLQMPSMDTMTYTGAVSFLAYNPDTGLFEQSPHKMEPVNRTITLTGSSGEMQELINNVGKNIPAGITFQFADGTHSMTSALTFSGFYGGTTTIRSSDTSTITNTTQAATLDFGGFSSHSILIKDMPNAVYLKNIKIINYGGGAGYSAIRIYNSQNVNVQYCYIISTNGGGGGARGVRAWEQANVYSLNNFILNQNSALISGPASYITSVGDVGTGNTNGYTAQSGILTKYSGDLGTTNTLSGGLVVGGSGAILP